MWNKRLHPAVPEGDPWRVRCSLQWPACKAPNDKARAHGKLVPFRKHSLRTITFLLLVFYLLYFLFVCFSARVPSRAGSSAAPSRGPGVPCSALCSSSDTNLKGEETGPETPQGTCELPWNTGTGRAAQLCISRVCHFTPEMLPSRESKWLYFPRVLLHLKIIKTCYIFLISPPFSHSLESPRRGLCLRMGENVSKMVSNELFNIKKKKKSAHLRLISVVCGKITPSFSCYILQQPIISCFVLLWDK